MATIELEQTLDEKLETFLFSNDSALWNLLKERAQEEPELYKDFIDISPHGSGVMVDVSFAETVKRDYEAALNSEDGIVPITLPSFIEAHSHREHYRPLLINGKLDPEIYNVHVKDIKHLAEYKKNLAPKVAPKKVQSDQPRGSGIGYAILTWGLIAVTFGPLYFLEKGRMEDKLRSEMTLAEHRFESRADKKIQQEKKQLYNDLFGKELDEDEPYGPQFRAAIEDEVRSTYMPIIREELGREFDTRFEESLPIIVDAVGQYFQENPIQSADQIEQGIRQAFNDDEFIAEVRRKLFGR